MAAAEQPLPKGSLRARARRKALVLMVCQGAASHAAQILGGKMDFLQNPFRSDLSTDCFQPHS